MAEAVLVQSTQGANQKNGTEHEKVKTASRGVSTWFGSQYLGKIAGGCLVMLFLQEESRRDYLFWGSFAPLLGAVVALLLPEKRTSKKQRQNQALPPMELKALPSSKVKEQAEAKEPPKVVQLDLSGDVGNQESPAEVRRQAELSDEIGRQEESRGGNGDRQRLIREEGAMGNFRKMLEFLKNPLIYKSVLLIFLNGFAPQSPQTKFYYYTTGLGFDASFIGTLKFISYVAVFLGVIVYDRYLRNINLKSFYTGTAIIGCLIALSQLILIFRINLDLGIPDRVFAALDTFVLELFLQFHGLPILVLACRMCPKNIEATIFGLLMSVCSMAYMVSLQFGALLVHFLGITSTNFDNLWILILTTSVFYLIPLTILQMIHFEDAMKQESPEGEAEAEITIHEHSLIETI